VAKLFCQSLAPRSRPSSARSEKVGGGEASPGCLMDVLAQAVGQDKGEERRATQGVRGRRRRAALAGWHSGQARASSSPSTPFLPYREKKK